MVSKNRGHPCHGSNPCFELWDGQYGRLRLTDSIKCIGIEMSEPNVVDDVPFKRNSQSDEVPGFQRQLESVIDSAKMVSAIYGAGEFRGASNECRYSRGIAYSEKKRSLVKAVQLDRMEDTRWREHLKVFPLKVFERGIVVDRVNSHPCGLDWLDTISTDTHG